MAEQAQNPKQPEPAATDPAGADVLRAAQETVAGIQKDAESVARPGSGAAPVEMPVFGAGGRAEQAGGIDLLADVNLNVKIELGRTRMLVEDVLRLGEGSVVELDKLAGDPVDVFVNDRPVARGEVLVLNDNFCVRINEIIKPVSADGAVPNPSAGRRGVGPQLLFQMAAEPPARGQDGTMGTTAAQPDRRGSPRRRAAMAGMLVVAIASGARAQIGAEPASPLPEAATTVEKRPLGAPHAGPLVAGGAPASVDRSVGAGALRTTVSLAVVLGLIFVAAAVVKRASKGRGGLAAAFGPGGPSPAGVLEILGRYPISRGQTLVLLRVDHRVLLLSHATGGRLGKSLGMSTLCELADPEEVASIMTKARDAEGDSLAAKFRGFLSQFDRRDPEPDGVTESPLAFRSVSVTEQGDRSELWQDGAAASVDHAAVADAVGDQPGAERPDPVGSLKRRLAALRGAGEPA